ncbi:hypothetical protein [Lactobacillus phage Maenad]|uniref:Uncharacterized protein n=1 Tax=Lactobacillus phage Maenad TaxID=2079431 RepID=A0A2P0ZL13_9CAUD|nr:host range and adsorption protein [Lactobacillus phage Maenad]AVH85653.1 hypothetical protein [Lactobacillus phage Maenad]
MADITHGTWIKDGKPIDAVYQNGRQVYGRNLISGSYDFSFGGITNNSGGTIQKVTMDSGEVALHVIGTSNSSGFYRWFNFPTTGKYVISVEVKGTGIVSRLGWENWEDPEQMASMTPTSDWQRVSRTTSFNSKGYAFDFYGTMDVYVRFLKLEKGTTATPYSLAPEDILK